MGRYLLIGLSSHSKKEDFGGLLGVKNVLSLIEELLCPNIRKQKGVVLRISLLCIVGGVCIHPSCVTLVSLRIC